MAWIHRVVVCVLSAGSWGCTVSVEESTEPAEARTIEQSACIADSGSTTTLYVAVSGSDSASGTCNAPFASLKGAHDFIKAQSTPKGSVSVSSGYATPSASWENNSSYTVYVRGGTYEQRSVAWYVGSATHRIKIANYPGEKPVFDGMGRQKQAIQLIVQRAEALEFEITGLTIRHYVQRGIRLGGYYHNRTDRTLSQNRTERHKAWTGGFNIHHNVFEEIGDVYNHVCLEQGTDCWLAEPMSTDDLDDAVKDDDGSPTIGLSGVGGFNTRHNDIHHNVFSHIESGDEKLWQNLSNGKDLWTNSRIMAHGFYVALDSDHNSVHNNFISHTSGEALKFMGNSSDNVLFDNFVMHSGAKGFFMNGSTSNDSAPDDPAGANNEMYGNVLMFAHPYRDSNSSRSVDIVPAVAVIEDGVPIVDSGNRFHDGRRPTQELVTAMATGDFQNDGTDEVVVALHYPDVGVTQVVRSGQNFPNFLNIPLYQSTSWRVNALSVGDFGSGTVLISSLHRVIGGVDHTELWRGDGNEFSGVKDDRFYQNDQWRVTAMVAVRNGGGDSDLLTAFSRSSSKRIYRGDDWSIGTAIEDDTGDVSALAAGYPSQISSSDYLYTATKNHDGNSATAIWEGNGLTTVFDFNYANTLAAVTAMAIGTVEGDTGPASFTAVNDANGTRLYRGRKAFLQTWFDDQIYSSTYWSIPAVAVRKRADGNRLVTAFDHQTNTQIREGNGLTGAVGDVIHKFAEPVD